MSGAAATPERAPLVRVRDLVKEFTTPGDRRPIRAVAGVNLDIHEGEIQALVGEGVKYVQIDAPRYSYYIDPRWRGYVQNEMGVDPERALDEAIRVDNECLADVRRHGVINFEAAVAMSRFEGASGRENIGATCLRNSTSTKGTRISTE